MRVGDSEHNVEAELYTLDLPASNWYSIIESFILDDFHGHCVICMDIYGRKEEVGN